MPGIDDKNDTEDDEMEQETPESDKSDDEEESESGSGSEEDESSGSVRTVLLYYRPFQIEHWLFSVTLLLQIPGDKIWFGVVKICECPCSIRSRNQSELEIAFLPTRQCVYSGLSVLINVSPEFFFCSICPELDEEECERRRTDCLYDMQDLERQFSELREQWVSRKICT